MKTYELTFIIGEKFTEEEAGKIREKVKKELQDTEIVDERFLGRKKLVYKIAKNDFGYYQTIIFKTEPENIAVIEKKLKSEEDILRYLIVNVRLTPKVVKKEKPEIKEKTEPKKKIEKAEEPKIKEVKKVEKAKDEVKKEKKIEKKAKPKITEELETEEKKLKELDEKLDEILKV